MNRFSHSPLPRGLYALCDDSVRTEWTLLQKAQALLGGGARVLQVRAKAMPARRLVEDVRGIVTACRTAGALCLVNDRVDIALVAGAHGVHLGDEDLAPADARRLLPAGALVGVTVRTAEAARQALEAGADYVGVGPVFSTRTKNVPSPVLGPEGLRDVVEGSPLPVVGIGGVTLDNVTQVAAAGAHGAAVVSDLLLAADISSRVRAFLDAWQPFLEPRSEPR